MNKFNVGDKVVIVSSGYIPNKPIQHLEVGDTGVVTRVPLTTQGRVYKVKMDEGIMRTDGSKGWAFYEHELALREN